MMRTALPAVAVAAVALALTACSSSKAGSAAPPSSPGPTVSAPSSSAVVSAPSTSSTPRTPPTSPTSSTPTEPSSSPVTSSPPPPAGTDQVVVRPVREDGTVVAGWTVQNSPVAVLCTPGEASPTAVDPNISYCSPSAAFAIACWQAADGAHVLCLYDLATHTVGRLPLDGSFPPVAAPHTSVPFALRLDNGTVCRIRDGGAASNLTNHPDWIPYYFCDHDTAVYGPRPGTGIDRSTSTWTVHTASMSGESDTVTRQVVAATFVGTQPS